MKNLYELVTEKDQRSIKGIKERINLANEWADEIYNTVNSDKHLTRSEWEQLRKVARQYKNHLKTIADPRKKIFLHLQENEALSKSLSARLEQSLSVAIDRLNANIDVIESKIATITNAVASSIFIDTLEKACPGKFVLIKDWFVDRGFCDPNTFVWKDKKKGQKLILAYYLKDLYIKGYTDNLPPVSIKAIAKNDFNVDMGIKTIYNAVSLDPTLPEIPATIR